MWRHLPNLFTIVRLLLVLPAYWLIGAREHSAALAIVAAAGASDALDGFLAKRFGWQSRLGALLDPLADKLLLLACFLGLATTGVLPAWLLLLVIGRDLLIVCGAVAYHNLVGPFDAEPTRLSKLTTFVQIVCVLGELVRLAWWPGLPGRDVLVWMAAVLTVASGLHYVVVWSLRARRTIRERHRGTPTP